MSAETRESYSELFGALHRYDASLEKPMSIAQLTAAATHEILSTAPAGNKGSGDGSILLPRLPKASDVYTFCRRWAEAVAVEPAWSIRLCVEGIPLQWSRVRLYDRLAVLVFQELCVSEAADGAMVINVQTGEYITVEIAGEVFTGRGPFQGIVPGQRLAVTEVWMDVEYAQ